MTLIHIDIDVESEKEANRILSLLNREHIPHQVQKKPAITEEQKEAARERMMRGAPTLNVNEMLKWLEESKKDRPMPFRDEE